MRHRMSSTSIRRELKLETVVNGKVIRAASLSELKHFCRTTSSAGKSRHAKFRVHGPANAYHTALTGTARVMVAGPGSTTSEYLNVWL